MTDCRTSDVFIPLFERLYLVSKMPPAGVPFPEPLRGTPHGCLPIGSRARVWITYGMRVDHDSLQPRSPTVPGSLCSQDHQWERHYSDPAPHLVM